MKLFFASALLLGATVAPIAHSSGSLNDVERAVQAARDHGITHFENVELDDDRNERFEIEGWIDADWFVELDMAADGTILREERSKRTGGQRGLTPDQVLEYARAASNEGVVQFDEIDVDSSGHIEIEGDDADGRDLEIDFEMGKLEPIRVDH